MKTRYYLLIGILSYLLFTLVNTPAVTVLSLLEKQLELPVKFYGVQGTIWNGQSDRLMMQGSPPVDNLHWSLKPLGLLTASLAADVKAQIKQQNVIGHVSVGTGGDVEASDVRARLDAKVVQQLASIPFGELGGYFTINMQSLRTAKQGLPQATGQVTWKNAKLTLMEAVDLGEVKLNIKPGKEGSLDTEIKNKGGDLSITGKANVMANRRYNVDLSFTPQNNASPNLKQSLSMFAKRQSNGAYRLKQSGNLNQLGL